jgi:hypothetical protein
MRVNLCLGLLCTVLAACPDGDTVSTTTTDLGTTTTGEATDETNSGTPTTADTAAATAEPTTSGTTTTGMTDATTTDDPTTGGREDAGARVLYFLAGPEQGQEVDLRVIDDTAPDGPAAPMTLVAPPNEGLFVGRDISPSGALMTLQARDVDLRAYLYLIDLATLDVIEATLPVDLTFTDTTHFSADEQLLGFRAGVADGPAELYLCARTPDGGCTAEVWSPPPMGDGGGLSIGNIEFSADGAWVAYGADLTGDGGSQLWLGSTTSPGEATMLAAYPESFTDIGGVRFSPAGDILYYRVDRTQNGVYEMFAVDLGVDPPGAPVQLSPPFTMGARGRVAPDGSALLWWSGDGPRGDLAWIPIDGLMAGPAVTINTDGPGRVLVADWSWSPDSKRVVYLSDHVEVDADELYTVDLGGPSPGDPVRVNAPLPAGGSVSGVFFVDDAQRIAYFARPPAVGDDLFLGDLASPGEAVQINPPLVAGGTLDPLVRLAPGGATIAYQGTQDDPDVRGLYLVDLTGAQPGAPVRVDPPLPPDAGVYSFSPEFSPDGGRLYFRFPEAAEQSALLRVAADGETDALQLTEPGEAVASMIVLGPAP